jgi:hypothetical protein
MPTNVTPPIPPAAFGVGKLRLIADANSPSCQLHAIHTIFPFVRFMTFMTLNCKIHGLEFLILLILRRHALRQ